MGGEEPGSSNGTQGLCHEPRNRAFLLQSLLRSSFSTHIVCGTRWCHIKVPVSESWATVNWFISLAGKAEPFLVICQGFLSVNREETCRRHNE